jgi:methanogenic corrinoid protein MtbC1
MVYSIADLEQLSGISTHTIRIWERRYKALTPARSSGNTRVYDDNQLKRLLNIVSLTDSGIKISDACTLTDNEICTYLEKHIEETISPAAHYEYYVSQVIAYGIAFNEPAINKLLAKCLRDHGMIDTYKNVIYPLLVRLGLMWRIDKICAVQEHFLSCIIKQKLLAAINDLPAPSVTAATWVLFLPEDEDHELGLLFASYLLRHHGLKVIYLGPGVPMNDLQDVLNNVKADNVLLFMIKLRKAAGAQKYLDQLIETVKHMPVFLSGNTEMINELNLSTNTHWLRSLTDFEQCLSEINDAC